MRRIPPLVQQCALVGVIALATAYAWLRITDSRTFTVTGLLACTAVSVAVAMAVEHAVRLVRNGRRRRAHARPAASRPLAGSANPEVTDTRKDTTTA